MKTAFFLLHYPVFSETFVSKEILNLQNLGNDGLIVCEEEKNFLPHHPHIKEILFPVIEISQKIFTRNFFEIISAHFYWFIKNPFTYLKLLKLLFLFFNFHHLRVFVKAPFLAKKIKNKDIDIIYVHEVDSPCLYGLICGKLLNIPCGIIIHTQYLFSQNKYLATKIKYADFIIFQSKYSLKQAQKITKLPKNIFLNKCHVLSSPGIDIKLFQPLKNPKFPNQIRLITIGRLEEAKGYPYLLKAIKILKKSFPNILLTIVGDGSQKNVLERYIKKNHLEKNIHLLGFISHNPKLIKLLHQHQYFILPSIIDSQNIHDVHPNVIKEAMSTGLITITSQLGGITEIIKNSYNGFLIDKITPKNLAKHIKLIHLLSKAQKITISQQARLTILKDHQQEHICSQLQQIFLNYINNNYAQ